jgi:50S ribosomal subunit-associated GTPase HflX
VARIGEWVADASTTREVRLPLNAGAEIARLHREAQVHEVEYLDDEVRMVATLPRRLRDSLAEFLVDQPELDQKAVRKEPKPAPIPVST